MQRGGFSLVELLVVAALVALLATIVLPPMARWRDALAVRAARDELAAALALTRITAAAAGGAALAVDPVAARYRVVTSGAAGDPVSLAERYGISVDGDRAFELRYDALGIGRLASRTVTIRRGSAEAGLVVSAYGRVRRW